MLLVFSLTLVACQDQLSVNSQQSELPPVKVTTLDKADIADKPTILSTLQKFNLQSYKSSLSLDSSQTEGRIGHLFEADLSQAKKIQIGERESYTFQLRPKDGLKLAKNTLMNMVLSESADGTYTKVMVLYKLTNQQNEQLKNEIPLTEPIKAYAVYAEDGLNDCSELSCPPRRT